MIDGPVLEFDESIVWNIVRGRRGPISLHAISFITRFPTRQVEGILSNLIRYGLPVRIIRFADEDCLAYAERR